MKVTIHFIDKDGKRAMVVRNVTNDSGARAAAELLGARRITFIRTGEGKRHRRIPLLDPLKPAG